MSRDPEAGRRLRAFVERHRHDDATWQEWAATVGVTKTAVMGWFAGKEPSLASIGAMAARLGVKRWEILACWDGNGP